MIITHFLLARPIFFLQRSLDNVFKGGYTALYTYVYLLVREGGGRGGDGH